MLAWLFWDPNPDLFVVPFLDRPVRWYGAFFVLGFIVAYFYLIKLFKDYIQENENKNEITRRFGSAKSLAMQLTDKLTWYAVLGGIGGARLGSVFFYDWAFYKENPIEIFKIWNGGLASHGGTIGLLITMALFCRAMKKSVPSITFVRFLDLFSIPVAFVAFCIRIGNFFNQEIIGYPTTMPWGVIFGHPVDGGEIVARHPTQLYEGFVYLITFAFLALLWKKKRKELAPGIISGLFFILVFGSRFFIEFFKVEQVAVVDQSFLQMGQYLSIPFIVLGFALLFKGLFSCNKKCIKTS